MALMIITIVVFNLIVVFMPKRITMLDMYTTSFFAFSLAVVTDIIFDLKLDLYGYFEKGLQLKFLFGLIGIYPAVNTLYLNFFPFKKRSMLKAIYIGGWSVFSLAYEWFASKTDFFYYNGWKLWYSALTYPVLFLILLLNYKFVRFLSKK